MFNILEELETKYPVGKIKADGQQVWPYLRSSYCFKFNTGVSTLEGEKSFLWSKSKLNTLVRLLSSSLYGSTNWFRHYDYISLSFSSDRVKVGDKYFDRLLDPLIDEVGPDRLLNIEFPTPKHFPIRKTHTGHSVSSSSFYLASMLLSKLPYKHINFENMGILDAIKEDYGLDVNPRYVIRNCQLEESLYRCLLLKVRPKALLLSDHSPHWAAIKASHELGIKVVEVLHGMIDKNHPGYNVYTELDKSFFPDYLLTLGRRELDMFDNSRFISPSNVYPIGSFYVEYLRNNFKPDTSLLENLRPYDLTVGVTLQSLLENRTMDFILKAANLDKGICYVIIPRFLDISMYYSKLPKNVIIIRDLNFYELIMHLDFHSTVYSTCAIEAPSLGVQNILINIGNRAKEVYQGVLTDNRVTRFVDTPEEYVETIRTFPRLDKDTICGLNEDLIKPNSRQNIREFVSKELG